MSSTRLPNYLRAHRKRLELSQDEVAYLLGAESGAKVCRYERFAREPSLQTALACEAVFHRPVGELFAGTFSEVGRAVGGRAQKLLARVDREKSKARASRRRATLEAIKNGWRL